MRSIILTVALSCASLAVIAAGGPGGSAGSSGAVGNGGNTGSSANGPDYDASLVKYEYRLDGKCYVVGGKTPVKCPPSDVALIIPGKLYGTFKRSDAK
jgi:hypothetical protein